MRLHEVAYCLAVHEHCPFGKPLTPPCPCACLPGLPASPGLQASHQRLPIHSPSLSCSISRETLRGMESESTRPTRKDSHLQGTVGEAGRGAGGCSAGAVIQGAQQAHNARLLRAWPAGCSLPARAGPRDATHLHAPGAQQHPAPPSASPAQRQLSNDRPTHLGSSSSKFSEMNTRRT